MRMRRKGRNLKDKSSGGELVLLDWNAHQALKTLLDVDGLKEGDERRRGERC